MEMSNPQHPQHRHTEHHKAANFSTGGKTDTGYHSSKQISTEDEEECHRVGPIQQGDDCNVGSKYGQNRLDDGHDHSGSGQSTGGFKGFGNFGQYRQGGQQQEQQQLTQGEQRQQEPSYNQQSAPGQSYGGGNQQQQPRDFEQAEYTPEHERHTGYAHKDRPDGQGGYSHQEVAHDDLDVQEPAPATHGAAQHEPRSYGSGQDSAGQGTYNQSSTEPGAYKSSAGGNTQSNEPGSYNRSGHGSSANQPGNYDRSTNNDDTYDRSGREQGSGAAGAQTGTAGGSGEQPAQVGGIMSYVPFTQAWNDTAAANRQAAEQAE